MKVLKFWTPKTNTVFQQTELTVKDGCSMANSAVPDQAASFKLSALNQNLVNFFHAQLH